MEIKKTWYKEMAVYQIWPRSFCDGNGDGIGDLTGVLSKLDYLKDLGIDAIWFSPLYPSPNADYGYDIADYRDISKDYGTLEQFRTVVDEAHKMSATVWGGEVSYTRRFQLGRMLSGITNYTSVVQSPKMKNARLKHISLIPVTEGTALAVVVTNSGSTSSTMLNVPAGITAQDLDKITHLMNDRMVGYKLTDVHRTLLPLLREEIGEQADSVAEMLGGISDDLTKRNVEVVGAANMLDYPEYADVSKAKSFLSEIEKGEIFKEVLPNEDGVEMTIRIGAENDNPELKDCSVVTVSYSVGGEQVGSMGVIGPTRMDYGKVVAVLKCMSESLSSVLSRMLKSGDPHKELKE